MAQHILQQFTAAWAWLRCRERVWARGVLPCSQIYSFCCELQAVRGALSIPWCLVASVGSLTEGKRYGISSGLPSVLGIIEILRKFLQEKKPEC